MDILHKIAERRIEEALARGEFDNLAGAGEPLALEDLSAVPEDLRAGYILLRGAGVLPEEIELKKEALRLGDLLAACESESERTSLEAKRQAILLRCALMREQRA